jgi:hypothetical protein
VQPVEPDVERHLDTAQDCGLDIVEGDLEPGDRVGTHFSTLHLGSPVPRQQLVEPVDGVIVDAGEHVGEPGLRIDAVEVGGLDQRVHHGGALAAAVGACEQPRLVGKADATIIEETRESVPSPWRLRRAATASSARFASGLRGRRRAALRAPCEPRSARRPEGH